MMTAPEEIPSGSADHRVVPDDRHEVRVSHTADGVRVSVYMQGVAKPVGFKDLSWADSIVSVDFKDHKVVISGRNTRLSLPVKFPGERTRAKMAQEKRLSSGVPSSYELSEKQEKELQAVATNNALFDATQSLSEADVRKSWNKLKETFEDRRSANLSVAQQQTLLARLQKHPDQAMLQDMIVLQVFSHRCFGELCKLICNLGYLDVIPFLIDNFSHPTEEGLSSLLAYTLRSLKDNPQADQMTFRILTSPFTEPFLIKELQRLNVDEVASLLDLLTNRLEQNLLAFQSGEYPSTHKLISFVNLLIDVHQSSISTDDRLKKCVLRIKQLLASWKGHHQEFLELRSLVDGIAKGEPIENGQMFKSDVTFGCFRKAFTKNSWSCGAWWTASRKKGLHQEFLELRSLVDGIAKGEPIQNGPMFKSDYQIEPLRFS